MEVLFQQESKNKLTFCFKDAPSIPANLLENKLFNGDKETSYISLGENNEIIMWVGIGEKDKLNPSSLFKSGVHAVKRVVIPRKIDNVKVAFAEELTPEEVFFLAEGILSSSLYTYTLKSDNTHAKELAHIVFENHQPIVQAAYCVAQSRNIVKELVDTPANKMTPEKIAEYAQENLTKLGVKVEIWDTKKLEKENMQGILSVGLASANAPYMLKLHHHPSGAKKKVCLIGKGIAYDSGGYSVKTNEGMKTMKGDMAGAATVIGLLYGIISMNLPIEIVAYLPLAENMIAGNAYKPGDVITYRNGKTVEITNTDAEGRLVLADALLLAGEDNYDLVVDIATLTGAIVVSLGNDIHGVFANKKGTEYAQSYVQFSIEKTSEMAWLMPIYTPYKANLRSSIADIQNTGTSEGSSINAALFLNEFVKEEQAWMHLDIAGTAMNKKDATGEATGTPVEALLLFLGSKFLEN